jgi:hypothetical protein
MAGGLLTLVSSGQTNVLLNGNPSKTFFKTTYKKYTNFGLQRFRVDFEGNKTLKLTEDSKFTFKIPRYAELLMDTYVSVDLPTIWSPIMPPNAAATTDPNFNQYANDEWIPYEFRWIENIGALMIRQIEITCGNQTLQKYSGQYLLSAVQRDFPTEKKALFDKMIGNIPELFDPANSGTRVNSYPNAYYTGTLAGPEPSIRGRTLYIPLNAWFNLNTHMAFPLVALQYNELHINITFRPINEIFQIRDVYDKVYNYPYVAPNFNTYYMQMYRFLQPPPDIELGINSYIDQRSIWNADIHLMCTYAFLSNDESKVFAENEQTYIFKEVHEQVFYNVTGPNKVQLNSIGNVIDWMFYFQRSDVNLRNEWSNYTNWPYNYLPQDIIPASTQGDYMIYRTDPSGEVIPVFIGPGVNPNGQLTGWFYTGNYTPQNFKNILVALGIQFDGQYRENMFPGGLYNYIEKYTRTQGNAPDGLYCYNFCLNTNPYVIQPSGFTNMSRFTNIEFEFTTIIPPVNALAQTNSICDGDGNIVGVNKPTWQIYDYNFNLVILEERVNFIQFIGGNAGLVYAN